MSHDLLISLIAFALVTAMTPGPNNTMLLASGVNFGFVRTQPHILGVVIGFTIMMLAVAFGVGRIFSVFPPLYSLLRTISIAYLLWLAWRIGTSGATDPVPGDEAGPMTFTEAALFQWINPKGWMVCLSVAANYVTPDNLWADVGVLSAVFLIASLGDELGAVRNFAAPVPQRREVDADLQHRDGDCAGRIPFAHLAGDVLSAALISPWCPARSLARWLPRNRKRYSPCRQAHTWSCRAL